MEILIGAGVVLIVVVNTYWSVRCRQVDVAVVDLSTAETRVLVSRCFSRLTWAPVAGPGTVNLRLRVPYFEGPTLSVNVLPTVGGSRVEVCTTSWSGFAGLVNFAAFALLKKRKISRALGQHAPSAAVIAGAEAA